MVSDGGEPDGLEPADIADQEVVTQRISRGRNAPPEIDQPRLQDKGRVSVIRGHKSPEDAYHLVRKGAGPTRDDGARYATVGTLRESGFVVTHTPNNRNPAHCSVTYPGDWDQSVALLFKACFQDRQWHLVVSDDE